MELSRLKIARKKKGLTQQKAADLIGVTASAWSSAERGASRMHRNNLRLVADKFDVSYSWLVTGEGSETMSMPAEIGPGKFVPILTTTEMLEGRSRDSYPKKIFIPDLEHDAVGYTTRSDLPTGVVECTYVVVESDLAGRFENGKWYLMAVDGLLVARKMTKVVFGKEKGNFKVLDWEGKKEFLNADPVELEKDRVKVWRIIWRVEKLGLI